MGTDPQDKTQDWFENNRSALETVFEVLTSDDDDALERLDKFAPIVAEAEGHGALTKIEHAAAALLGRGCNVVEVEKLTSLTGPQLAMLGTREDFQDVCDTHRIAWVNEKIAVLQQYIDRMPIDSPKNALAVMGSLNGLIKRRDDVMRNRRSMELQIMKMQEDRQMKDDQHFRVKDMDVIEVDEIE